MFLHYLKRNIVAFTCLKNVLTLTHSFADREIVLKCTSVTMLMKRVSEVLREFVYRATDLRPRCNYVSGIHVRGTLVCHCGVTVPSLHNKHGNSINLMKLYQF